MNIPFLVYHNLQFEQPHPSNISAVMTFFQVRRRSGSSNSPTSSVSVSSSSSSSGSTFKVAVRVRPLLEKERKELALQVRYIIDLYYYVIMYYSYTGSTDIIIITTGTVFHYSFSTVC